MTTISPPALDAWKVQPRATDGTWGEKPLPAPPPIERPDYDVIRSRGRMTILGHKFVIKFDTRRNLYHYNRPKLALQLLGPEFQQAVGRADFLVDCLNDGTFDIHGLSAATGLLKAFNRDAQKDGNSRLRLPANIPAEINPAAVIARWMTAGERSPKEWSRAIDVLFGHGDKSDCLSVNVDTGDHSPWDRSDIDIEAVADCVDMLTERIEAARSRDSEPLARDFDSWAESVAKLPPYRFLRVAVQTLALDDQSLISPEMASRWFSGVIGPCPYHPAALRGRVRGALSALMQKTLDSPERLIEFLQRVRDSDECYGTAVAKTLLLETATSNHHSPEALDVAWDIVLRGDPPDVMRKAMALHGVHSSEMSPDAATFLPRERSTELNQHLREISFQSIIEDYTTASGSSEPYLPPVVAERLQRADEALRRCQRELAEIMPGGLSGVAGARRF